MIIETIDPGCDTVRLAVDEYVRLYPDYADVLRMYGGIMEAQQSALETASCPLEPLSDEERESRLVSGEPLLDPLALEIDGAAYRRVMTDICQAVGVNTPGGFKLAEELLAWKGLSDERVDQTRDAVLEGKDLRFEPSGGASEEDLELLRDLLWEGLAPFYRICGRILAAGIDQSLWQRGYCPVCGGAPLIGKFREDDGLWVVECSFCHTLWNIQRTGCPFCDKSQGSLDFLYLEGDRARRANYCKSCRKYVKTIDARDGDENLMLPFENIVTAYVDIAAKQEDLIPA